MSSIARKLKELTAGLDIEICAGDINIRCHLFVSALLEVEIDRVSLHPMGRDWTWLESSALESYDDSLHMPCVEERITADPAYLKMQGEIQTLHEQAITECVDLFGLYERLT